jgi:hypothetical protein
MIFYKAKPTAQKPYIYFQSCANSLEELIAKGLENDPLVLPEELLPVLVYDVYSIKIVSGELVERTVPEMEAFEDEYNTEQSIRSNIAMSAINTGTFTYASNSFPMNERARLFYQVIEKVPGNYKVMKVDGSLFDLIDTSTNRADFIAAFYLKLNELTKPV